MSSTARTSAAVRLVRRGRRGRFVLRSYHDDFRRNMRQASTLDANHDEMLLGRIAARYHSIEKGQSLYELRLGFGERALVDAVRAYGPARGGTALDWARDALGAYVAFHAERSHDAYPLRDEIAALLTEMGYAGTPGVGDLRAATREKIACATGAVTADTFLSRHSDRQCSREPVLIAAIKAAAPIAQEAPVVCDRQSGRIYLDPDTKRDALRLQACSKGSEHGLDKLLVVTTDLSNIWNAGERNQAYGDSRLAVGNESSARPRRRGLGRDPAQLQHVRLHEREAAPHARPRRIGDGGDDGRRRPASRRLLRSVSHRKPLHAVLHVHSAETAPPAGVFA